MKKARLAILASGSGTNAEEIIKYFQSHPFVEIALLLSNNPDAYALTRAKKYGIETKVFNRSQFRETEQMLDWLKAEKVTHLVLAGFLWLVPQYLVKAFPDHIINIHPALLPKYGGKGMYGMHVHEAVKVAHEKETGITIHKVNERYDEGQVLFQATCEVSPSDTPDQIAAKVHHLEHAHYPRMIEQWIKG